MESCIAPFSFAPPVKSYLPLLAVGREREHPSRPFKTEVNLLQNLFLLVVRHPAPLSSSTETLPFASSAAMKLAVVVAVAFGLSPATGLSVFGNDKAIAAGDDLDVPGDSPLKFCNGDRADHVIKIEKVDLQPNPPEA